MSFRRRAVDALADEGMRRAVRNATAGSPEARLRAMGELDDAAELREAARAIRARDLARAPELLAELADRLQQRGVRVHWADDAAQACAAIRQVCAKAGARLVVKSKSMVTEEIGLNTALEADGVQVVETDLGEFIVQVAGQPPSHILAPAIHLDRHGVARVLSQDAGHPLDPDPAALTTWARGRLRRDFMSADVGISGVNFAVAQTGTVVLVTNEGNGRLVTSLPRVHIAVMGLERIVATPEDLDVLLTLLPRSATGQRLTVYTSLIAGPRAPGEADGPEEMHLVIVDNGRSAILGSEYREILHCIRCGACLNVCPVYRQVGGHAYGSVYSGPVGAVLTPLLRAGHAELAGASSLCAACHEACPVGIPLQDLLLRLRQRREPGDGGRLQRLAFRAWAAAWSSPRGYRLSGWLATRVAPAAARLGLAPGPAARWLDTREIPDVPSKSFLGELRRRGPS